MIRHHVGVSMLSASTRRIAYTPRHIAMLLTWTIYHGVICFISSLFRSCTGLWPDQCLERDFGYLKYSTVSENSRTQPQFSLRHILKEEAPRGPNQRRDESNSHRNQDHPCSQSLQHCSYVIHTTLARKRTGDAEIGLRPTPEKTIETMP